MKTSQAQVYPVYPAVFNPIPAGGYDVSFPDFPGCVTFGRTFEEAQTMAAEVLSLWLEELKANHQTVPRRRSTPILTEVKAAAV